MVLKFYYDLLSPPARAVYLTIKHLDIPVEMVYISLADMKHKSEDYLKINPLGTVPCIEDDGFVLLDSHAINIYLTTKFPQGEKLNPSDPQKRAIVNERLFFAACELSGVTKVTTRKVFMQGLKEIDESTVNHFESSYSALETYLKKSKYVAGDSLTIADFSVMVTMSTMKLFVPLNKEKFPSVNAYLEDSLTWPFYEEAHAAGFNKLLELMKAKNIPFPK